MNNRLRLRMPGVKTETLTSESQGKEIKRDNESHEKGRKMYSRSLRTKESGGEGGWLEKEGQEAGGLRRGAGGAGQEVCNGSLGGGQVRTEEVDEHRWIRGQMSLQSKDIQHLSQWNQPPPLSSLYTGCPKKCTHTGCPRKKYLSEISGSQIHVTITGQPNKQICMKWSNSP